MTYFLEALTGSLKGSRYPFTERLVIGRDAETDVQLLEQGVSREHAAILVQADGSLMLMDLASTNGTFVDESSVGRIPIELEGEFQVAESRFRVKMKVEAPLPDDELELLDLHVAGGLAVEPTVVNQALSSEDLQKLRALRKK